MSAVIAGRYRLEEKIASGGMGEVWTARDQTLGRRVAVKLLRDSLAQDTVVAERFRREALTAASLSHPNMAEVYDYVEEDGRPGIVMEMVDGETLADRLRRGRLEVGEAVRIASEVLEALGAAHDAGIVHRDVKPGNIMLTPKGKVKVTDFGIARAEGDSTLTETGAVMGTAHYAAPEQVQGRGSTPASDLYSLGIVLYEGLTGRKPFEAETPVAAALARLTTDPPRPRTYRADIPPAVEAATMRALERDPAARYPNAAAMREALTQALAAADTEAMATQAYAAAAGDGVTGVLPVAAEATRVLPVTVGSGDATTVLRPVPAPVPSRRERRAARQVPAGRREHRARPSAVSLLLLIGVLVAVAGLVLLFRSRGPSLVAVPSLTNKTVQLAIGEANRLGFQVDLQSVNSNAKQDTVIRQSPAPPDLLAEGATITLVVSKGPAGTPCCTVPRLIGLSEEAASDALGRAGLRRGSVTKQARQDVREGTVIAQSLQQGRVVAPGATVDIVVAEKPDGDGKGNGKGKGGERD